MNKRLRITLLILVVVMISLAAWFTFRIDEPVYQGKRLSKWLQACDYNDYKEPETDTARAAVRQIGTNAIPYLLRKFQAPDYVWERTAARIETRWNTTLKLPTTWKAQENALIGFEVLERAAAPAIPELLKLCAGTNEVALWWAFQALPTIGDESVIPQLISWLAHTNSSQRLWAMFCLGRFGYRAKAAVTNLIPLLEDSDLQVRYCVMGTLGEIGAYPEITIPILMKGLADSHPYIRRTALNALAPFGQQAAAALPAVQTAIQDQDSGVSSAAQRARKRILLELSEGTIIRGNKERKAIALAFTGHEFGEGGETILHELARKKAQASFFLTGDFITNALFAPLVTRIIEEGHYFGLHSDRYLRYCAPGDPEQTLVTREELWADLLHNHWKFTQVTPRQTGRFFIPPFRQSNRQIADWAIGRMFIPMNFTPGTLATADATRDADKDFVSSQAIFDSIVQKEHDDPHGLNGFVLVFHLGSGPGRADKFHDRLGELLDYLASKEYHFIRVDELLQSKRENADEFEPKTNPSP